MIQIEKYNAEDKRDLAKRERYYKELLKSRLNTNTPGRTKKEWEQDNKEQIREYYKEYHQDNKEHLNELSRQYNQDNKEKIKQYKQDHKEQIKQYQKQYTQKNKEKRNQKFNCPCGGRYTSNNKTPHERSKKHQRYLNTI